MPASQLERRRADHWIEEPCEEIGLGSHHYVAVGAAPLASEELPTDVLYANTCLVSPYFDPEPYYRFLGAHDETSFEQAVWNLFRIARVKLARDDFTDFVKRRENERLIKEINEAYDEEMEREDKEFAKRTKGYYRRLLDTED